MDFDLIDYPALRERAFIITTQSVVRKGYNNFVLEDDLTDTVQFLLDYDVSLKDATDQEEDDLFQWLWDTLIDDEEFIEAVDNYTNWLENSFTEDIYYNDFLND